MGKMYYPRSVRLALEVARLLMNARQSSRRRGLGFVEHSAHIRAVPLACHESRFLRGESAGEEPAVEVCGVASECAHFPGGHVEEVMRAVGAVGHAASLLP